VRAVPERQVTIVLARDIELERIGKDVLVAVGGGKP
jgi:hypothetical protein